MSIGKVTKRTVGALEPGLVGIGMADFRRLTQLAHASAWPPIPSAPPVTMTAFPITLPCATKLRAPLDVTLQLSSGRQPGGLGLRARPRLDGI